ncbi:sigma-70 family RNA polymerase sigma factor [Marivirga sp. S37H4]|uniref:Sigma-70 family RNA polymerase sigma factor n=2 Tax=Marivirga aurantiaca TaxID=2802615 RepID=A0A935CB68_9BACT|nr:sigma-70 family RNA polymerase sigma factor [Marivirga aurantiaca]
MHLVYGVCLKYFKDREQSQDAVMAIFEELIIKLPKFEIENFKSWLYVLSKNHCLMELRKQKRSLTDHLESSSYNHMENVQFVHHDDEALTEENLDRLNDCIAQLKIEQKQCIELFYLEKKSYQEIVETTAFDLKKVKSYIQNGKRNLKQCMEQQSE